MPGRLFQRHGGWRSKKVQNNYVKESLDSLPHVTKDGFLILLLMPTPGKVRRLGTVTYC